MSSQNRRHSSMQPELSTGASQWLAGHRTDAWNVGLQDFDEAANSARDAAWDDGDENNSSEIVPQELNPDAVEFKLSAIPKHQKMMQMKMMRLLFKILYQTPEISILRR